MVHKIIVKILAFIINHKRLYRTFVKYKWFKDLMYDEAQRIIGNRR